jgi:hypothetical protein
MLSNVLCAAVDGTEDGLGIVGFKNALNLRVF